MTLALASRPRVREPQRISVSDLAPAGPISMALAVSALSLVAPSSAATYGSPIGTARVQPASSGAMMLAREEDIVPPVPAIMAEVKRLSGLTWDQLGKILGVSRRTVHNWTNGETVRPGHLTNLLSLLERIRGLRDMPAFKVRQALLRESGMAESMRVLESNEPPILAADNRSFAHQLEVGPSSLRMKRD